MPFVFILLSASAIASKPCGTLTINHQGTCQELGATIDASACGVNKPLHVSITCKNDTEARAHAKTDTVSFSAQLVRSSSGWGNTGDWSLQGAVTMKERKKPTPTQATADMHPIVTKAPTPASAPIDKTPTPEAHPIVATPPAPTSALIDKTPTPASAPIDKTPIPEAHPIVAIATTATDRAPASVPPEVHPTGAIPTTPALSAEAAKTAPTFQIAGYFDAYYAYNPNNPGPVVANGGLAPQQNSMIFYPIYANQPSLNLVELTFRMQKKETSFFADLDFGPQAEINASTFFARFSGGPDIGIIDQVTKHVGQAVFGYTPESLPQLTLEIGKMYTHIGLETPKAKDNWNYSRSNIFSFSPFWHTGVHIGYAFVPNIFVANAYIYNGIDFINAPSDTPTFGLQLKWTPHETVTLIYNNLGGPIQNIYQKNWQTFHEVNATWIVSERFSLATDLILGSSPGVLATPSAVASWAGVQVGSKWQITPKWFLSPRIDLYRDNSGYALGRSAQTIGEATLTSGHQISDGFEARMELRTDRSSLANRYITRTGAASNQTLFIASVLVTL